MPTGALAIAAFPGQALPAFATGPPLDPAAFAAIRRRAVLECCKWDPQVGDVSSLADFPLVFCRDAWRELAGHAERLARELLAAEEELLHRPELHGILGLPRALRLAFRRTRRDGPTPAAARVMRFDFHPTPDGWRLSEVNSDVPGGYSEASSFTAMMAEGYPRTRPAGNPGAAWADAIARAAGGGAVALLSAPGFMEDHQILAYLALLLRARGCTPHLGDPRMLRWGDGRARLARGPLGAVVRFYQGEWLGGLPRRSGWEFLLHGGRTPVTNPGSAILTESKRFPLVWESLRTPLTAWRALLPETRDPRDAPWRTDDGWLLKTAYSNNGDTVSVREFLDARKWRAVCLNVWWSPGAWAAQRRFAPAAVETPAGPMYPCIGVYTVDGRAAGAYARLSPRPVIDYRAVDAACLVETPDGGPAEGKPA